jgi:hypothetical protein
VNKITFGKTETYTQGWKGKTSKTDIKVNGKVVGEIVGTENIGIAGAMFWKVEVPGRRPQEAGSFKDAKLVAANLLSGPSTTPTLDGEISKLQPKLGENHKLVTDYQRLKREHGAMKVALAALVERYGPSFGYSGDQRDELANAEKILADVDKP